MDALNKQFAKKESTEGKQRRFAEAAAATIARKKNRDFKPNPLPRADSLRTKTKSVPVAATAVPVAAKQTPTPNTNATQSTSVSKVVKPQPWTAIFDPTTGKTYYHNTETNVTTWTPPKGEKPPVPPRK